MPSFAVNIEEREHIYIYLKLVLIEMNIIMSDWVMKIGELIVSKHLFRVENNSKVFNLFVVSVIRCDTQMC